MRGVVAPHSRHSARRGPEGAAGLVECQTKDPKKAVTLRGEPPQLALLGADPHRPVMHVAEVEFASLRPPGDALDETCHLLQREDRLASPHGAGRGAQSSDEILEIRSRLQRRKLLHLVDRQSQPKCSDAPQRGHRLLGLFVGGLGRGEVREQARQIGAEFHRLLHLGQIGRGIVAPGRCQALARKLHHLRDRRPLR